MPNVKDEPHDQLAQLVLLGARTVTAGRVGSSALLALSFFDANAAAKDSVQADPTIDSSAVIPDLEPFPLDGLYKVQVLEAIHLAENNIANLQILDLDRNDRAELA